MGRSSPAAPPRSLTLRHLVLSTHLLPRGSGMFDDASLFNSDLSNWGVSKVTATKKMFTGAMRFTSDLSNWDVSKVTDTEYMFTTATRFT